MGRHWIIKEEFSTSKDGTMGNTLEQRANILEKEVSLNTTVTFRDILKKKWAWQYAASYTTGSILCRMTYDKGAVALVNKLLERPDDDKKLMGILCSLFEIRKEALNAF